MAETERRNRRNCHRNYIAIISSRMVLRGHQLRAKLSRGVAGRRRTSITWEFGHAMNAAGESKATKILTSASRKKN